MTFTKEKLAELQSAMSTVESRFIVRERTAEQLSDRYFEEACNAMDLVQEAAKSLPHYITALAEAESVIEKERNEIFYCMTRGREYKHGEAKERMTEALTTIRQLARGKE